MEQIQIICLIITIFLTFYKPSNSSATVYYVKFHGNDNNNGQSIANAWKTIQKVSNSAFCAGDTIKLEGGNIFEGVNTIGAKLWVSSSGRNF